MSVSQRPQVRIQINIAENTVKNACGVTYPIADALAEGGTFSPLQNGELELSTSIRLMFTHSRLDC